MRHANIQTTMNVDSKGKAHSKVVELILKSRKTIESEGRADGACAVGA